jgi:hypothetical protein
MVVVGVDEVDEVDEIDEVGEVDDIGYAFRDRLSLL